MIVDRSTQRQFPPKYIENPFRAPYNYSNCSVIYKGNLSSLFNRNYESFNIIFWIILKFFLIPSLLQVLYPKVLILFIWRKPVSYRRVTLLAERKKTLTPTGLRACTNCLAFAMRALYRYGSPLMRPALGHKILVVIPRWSH